CSLQCYALTALLARPGADLVTCVSRHGALLCSWRRGLSRQRCAAPLTCAASAAMPNACVVYGPLGTPRLKRVRVVLGAAACGLAGTGQWWEHSAPYQLVPPAPTRPRISP